MAWMGTGWFESFNPRPREGATHAPENENRQGPVSIHAPVKGRLTPSISKRLWKSFNPRPREGATYRYAHHFPRHDCFNPRPREGATYRYYLSLGLNLVSIHAPVKGRLKRKNFLLCRICFNPRPREGATKAHGWSNRWTEVSIHAPVKGRPIRHRCESICKSFNPRPREGATYIGVPLIP